MTPPMPEHHPKNTVEARLWCNPCGRETMHRIDHGRQGSCLVCLKLLEKQMSLPGTETSEPVQGEMFLEVRKDVG